MICPECNGKGESIYYVETDRDENTVTIKQRKGICRTCNGSGQKHISNADRIRAMSDEELATFIYSATRACNNYECENCPIGDENCPDLDKWLRQPAEMKEDERMTDRRNDRE